MVVYKQTITIGDVEVQLSESADESLQRILNRVQELQESPQVFLSYSHKDVEFAKHLVSDLQNQGVRMWLADEQIKVGDNILDTIYKGISSSQWAIVLLSENILNSDYISKELLFALEEERKRDRPFLLPAIMGDIELPMELQLKHYVDFREDYSRALESILARIKPSKNLQLKHQSKSENKASKDIVHLEQRESAYFVAIVGAGTAGLFAARELANQGVQVVLFNRDVKPGGLAEYGIYPEKFAMKEGLRKQFHPILENKNVRYYGNVTVGDKGDLTLAEVRALGFQAVLISTGAQGTKWLGIPGEHLQGVYHAKNIAFFYNKLPPYSQMDFQFGRRCAIIGAGNVMLDIARYLINTNATEEIISVVRRGPAEVNFSREEMKYLAPYLDIQAFENEMQRILPALQAINQDPELGRRKILDALSKQEQKLSNASFRFKFLTSPSKMIGKDGKLTHLEVEENILVEKNGKIITQGTGEKRILELDSVIYAIGEKADENFGLPIRESEFVRREPPIFPVEGNSYESTMEGVFLGGWSPTAVPGTIGFARRDGSNAAKAILQYLKNMKPRKPDIEAVETKIESLDKSVVTWEDIKLLRVIEADEAKRRGLQEFKFASNEEMFHAMQIKIEA